MNIVFGPHLITLRNNCKTYDEETDRIPGMCTVEMRLFWLCNMLPPNAHHLSFW